MSYKTFYKLVSEIGEEEVEKVLHKFHNEFDEEVSIHIIKNYPSSRTIVLHEDSFAWYDDWDLTLDGKEYRGDINTIDGDISIWEVIKVPEEFCTPEFADALSIYVQKQELITKLEAYKAELQKRLK